MPFFSIIPCFPRLPLHEPCRAHRHGAADARGAMPRHGATGHGEAMGFFRTQIWRIFHQHGDEI